MAVLRNFTLPRIFGREGTRLQLRAEFFNIFNHPNLYVDAGTNDVGFDQFTQPGSIIARPGVTVRRGNDNGIASTSGVQSYIDNRQVVIAVKFIF